MTLSRAKPHLYIVVFALLSLLGVREAYAASIYMSPGSGTYAVGATVSVSVRVNTAGQAVNTGEATISYSADTLELISASQGATFSLAAPDSPKRSAGSVYFGGGIPSPGYTGSAGVLGTLNFRIKNTGVGTVSVTSGKTLLNDGFGTDAYTGATGARFTLVSSAAPTPFSAPTISSPTHPDQNRWYATSSPVFTWTLPQGGNAVSFVFDTNANTVPDAQDDQAGGNAMAFSNIADGASYFHIRARVGGVFGATSHYRVQIDATPPEKFALNVATDVNGIPTVSFETTDAGSGIARYELRVDEELVEENATSPYELSSISRGKHTVTVVAYDHAGNAQEASASIFVDKKVMLSLVFITLLLLLNLIITILLLILIWLEIGERRRRAPVSDRVERARHEIDESLSRLRIQAQERLSTISAVPARDIVAKEKRLEDEMAGILLEAKSHIDKTVNDLGDIPEKKESEDKK